MFCGSVLLSLFIEDVRHDTFARKLCEDSDPTLASSLG